MSSWAFGPTPKKRKGFKVSTKKIEWMSAGGHDPLKWRTNFIKTSECRKCHCNLKWGDRSYDFDHKDNNSSDNSQGNCYLVCKSCHGKATKIDKIKTRGAFGEVRYKTIKRKLGYKKPRKTGTTKTVKKTRKKTTRKNPWTF